MFYFNGYGTDMGSNRGNTERSIQRKLESERIRGERIHILREEGMQNKADTTVSAELQALRQKFYGASRPAKPELQENKTELQSSRMHQKLEEEYLKPVRFNTISLDF